jgi:hypothetical protein
VGEVERNHYDRNLLLKGKPVTTGTGELARNPQPSAYAIMSAAGVEDPISSQSVPWQWHLNDTIA